ncbi:hypothetical protein [Pseudoxanthomonas sp.]|uniref:hypothetical protein n=1 Tax=Pseudoxanthomonas sp. TaxID=1871049 RepID=UPI00260A85D6|nr:hypothetical protein [Pseudoxanthomonas sp.]WDS37358.1 MAG: hypothetical protein O8I58_05605 [Pseudoxanthomonas sp.]
MVRVFKWFAAGVLAIGFALVAVYGLSRAMGPTKAEQQALQALQPGKPPTGTNGFTQLWLLPYAVPADAQAAVLKADLARFAKAPGAFKSTAEDRWPREGLVDPPGLQLCGWKDQDCLARVRGNQAGYAAAVASNAPLAARVEALHDAGYVRNPFPLDPMLPFPAYQLLSAPQTGHALTFVRGHRQEALAGVCRDARTARMLGKDPDYLIGGMISLAMLRGTANLFTEMLAALPDDAKLPDECVAAFAPLPTDAANVCKVMQREFAFVQSGVGDSAWQSVQGTGATRGHWLFNRDKTVARMAVGTAWPCEEGGKAQVAADQPVTTPAVQGGRWEFRCLANAVGCTLADMGPSNFDDYSRRGQDGMARLRLVSVALWLRTHPKAGLDDLPPELQRGRPLTLDSERGTLSMALFSPQDGQDRWEIPLPAPRLRTAR